VDAESQKSLQWLGDQHFEEQRSLRAAEDNLFNWAMSLFLAGFGALTGLRGITTAQWSAQWRLLIMLGLVVIVAVILLMAFLIRFNYERNQAALARIMAQLRQTGGAANIPEGPSFIVDRLFFYLRWSAVGAMGLILLVLVWMLG